MAVNVANAPGKDYKPEHPSGYDSWIDYWNKKCNKKANRCRNCGTKAEDLKDGEIVGGHIEYCDVEYCEEDNEDELHYHKEKGIFITSLCSECNNPDNMVVFTVDTSDLVKIP
jgi:hypothetical protein